jgi:prepilin-type N-terminal cleavage/methylation domain-containing protein/prepilin-type processing-associated H-X9-DG protein
MLIRKKTTKAFTLIELLVVIAIIALLLSIIMPALKETKKRAMGIFCLANLRSLATAWTLYADENDNKMCSSEVWGNYSEVQDFDWVHPVISTSDPLYTHGMTDHQRELAGIRKGALFPYTETVDVYNCPGDKTWKTAGSSFNAYQSPFRSYAGSNAMNGQYNGGGSYEPYQYKKVSDIKLPALRMVFLEEEEADGANWGSWVLSLPPTYAWWDPISIWHSKSSTNLAFADGHAAKRNWVDQSTLDMAKNQDLGVAPYPGEGEDLEYIRNAYHHDLD